MRQVTGTFTWHTEDEYTCVLTNDQLPTIVMGKVEQWDEGKWEATLLEEEPHDTFFTTKEQAMQWVEETFGFKVVTG